MTTTTTGAGAQVPDFRLTPELSEFQQKIRDYCRDIWDVAPMPVEITCDVR